MINAVFSRLLGWRYKTDSIYKVHVAGNWSRSSLSKVVIFVNRTGFEPKRKKYLDNCVIYLQILISMT